MMLLINLRPQINIHQLRCGEIDPSTLLLDRIDIKELERFASAQIEFEQKNVIDLQKNNLFFSSVFSS